MSNTGVTFVIDPEAFLAASPLQRRKWTLTQIHLNPEAHDQLNWVRIGACGTSACIAGTACLLAGYRPDLDSAVPISADWVYEHVIGPSGVRQTVFDAAGVLLGLGWATAHDLFYDLSAERALDKLDALANEEDADHAA